MSQNPPIATSSTGFETIFSAALEAYNKQTKKDIASHPLAVQLQSCNSPSAILSVLRTQVQAFDRSQSADEHLTKWLDPTVHVLYAFSATLGNGVGQIFPPSNAIFAGIGVLLQAVKDVRASQNVLVDLFGRMEYFFKRLEEYIEVRPTAAMTDIIVKIMIEVISILGIVTKEIGRGRMKRYLTKLVGRRDVEDALQRLDRLTQEEARMAAAEVLTIARGIDNQVKGVIEGVKENEVAIQKVVNQVSDLDRNELRKDLRKWVAPSDPSVNYNSASGAHHEGTAAWCTKGNTLAKWKTSGSLLWIHGKPGSGKSILSSVIIRDIKSMSNAGSALLAYFYFDFKDTAKQDSRALLSSLLVQLSDQSDIFCDALFSLHSAHKRGSEQPTDDSLAQCLKGTLTTMTQMPIYLIMDALDECPNDSGIPSSREKVLELVKELAELHRPNLRLCVMSRPEFDIRTTLGPLATQQLSLHGESGQKQDINDYVTFVVNSDRRMMRWRDDDKDAVIQNLTEKADGMFRWVFCQLEVLRHCFPTNLRRVLEELPKSLDETYKRILKEINNANREHAYRLLQCLAVARRPLRVEELAEVLVFDLSAGGIPTLVADWRWEDQEEAVLSACSSLVSVVIDNGSRVVQFSHFSVKEFLTSERLASCMEEESRFHLPIEPSHVVLAQACLGVFLRLDDHTDEDSVEKIPLLQYAIEHWVGHIQVGNVELQIKDAMDCFFDMDKPHLSAWDQMERRYDLLMLERLTARPLSAGALYVAAERGFYSLVERLIIKHPEQVNNLDRSYGAPLHASVLQGHIKVSQLLLAHGADVNLLCKDKWTSLHIASQKGHLDLGKWLLHHGADTNAQTKFGSTSLHIAASCGHLEFARMLLEHSMEVNFKDDEGCTPLLKASAGGHSDIVRLLLAHNADVHVHDNRENTPLHSAVSSDFAVSFDSAVSFDFAVSFDPLNSAMSLDILDFAGSFGPPNSAVSFARLKVAQLLLEHNVEFDSRNYTGTTPLLKASASGYPDIVQLLLDHHADVHVHDNSGNNPLHYAAFRGRLEVAQILLKHNAEVNIWNKRGYTPFFLASASGNPNVVRLLLDHNADVCVHDDRGNTPLHIAASCGHLEVAQILLEHRADVNSRNDDGSTPFLRAAACRNPEIMRLLLDNNVDVNVHDNRGMTPLHFAAFRGQPKVAQMLLEHNADINSRDDHGCTPLLIASRRGHPNVVQLLLDHDADAHVRDDDGNTPLHCAVLGLASGGQLCVAQILLELNAEVNSQNNKGSTPLHLASELREENSEAMWLLLDYGASVQVRDRSGRTASEIARDSK